MTTTTFSSKEPSFWGLLGSLLRRNLPAGCYFFGATFFFFPLQYILEIFRDVPRAAPDGITGSSPNLYTAANIYTPFSLFLFYGLMLLVPVVLTLSQMNWLHSKRAADLYHSLPVGRRALLYANGAAAFLTIAVPTLFHYAVILAAGGIRLGMKTVAPDSFALPVGEILLDLGGWLVTELSIIAVILLVGTQVGSVFEHFAFSAELLCAPAAILLLTNAVCGQQLLGYDPSGFPYRGVAYSSPVSLMAGRYSTLGVQSAPATGDWMILLWLALALAILWAAGKLYLRRPSELAETSGAREPLNTLGRLGAVYLGGLILGEFFTYVTGIGSFPAATFLGSALVAVLCQVVLGRGFRDLKRALPSMAVIVGAVTLAAAAMTTGGLGYEGRIPSVESAGGVTINYRGRYGEIARRIDASSESGYSSGSGEYYWYGDVATVTLTTPEAVELVREIHRSFVENGETGGYGNRFTIAYENGLRRSYSFSDRDADLFLALEQNPEFQEKTNPLLSIDESEILSMRISDATGLVTGEAVRDKEQIRILLAAAREDARRFDLGSLRDGTARAAAYLTVETAAPREGQKLQGSDCWRSFCIPVYGFDLGLQAAVRQLGQGELLEDHSGEVVGISVDSWSGGYGQYGGCSVFWYGGGPQDLWGVRDPGDPLSQFYGDWLVRDPQEVESLLKAGLGVDYHLEGNRSEEEGGFIITLVGKDRQGASFWIPKGKATPAIREQFSYFFDGPMEAEEAAQVA